VKVGVFGGTFNPPHFGHINSMVTVQKKIGLEKIYVVPANQNPLKTPLESPSGEHRVEMLKRALSTYGESFVISDEEIKRGGLSFTIDTVMSFRLHHEAKDLFLIIGADKFEELEKWKDWEKLLKEVNLVVTTRPGHDLPHSKEDLPLFLKSLVADFDFNFVELTTGRSVQFVSLNDLELSSSTLRKQIRAGRPIDKYIPLAVENYIKEHRLYSPLSEKVSDYSKFTEFCAQYLISKKGIAVKALDLKELNTISEYAIIASGTSTRHSSALAENLVRAVREEFRIHPQGIEGTEEGRWVVIDYGSLVIHVFYDFVRSEYNLEKLWKNAVDLRIKE